MAPVGAVELAQRWALSSPTTGSYHATAFFQLRDSNFHSAILM
jgi:hypothetical protein